MIREYNEGDLTSIDIIGKQIKDDFVTKYNLKELNKKIENILVYETNNEVVGFIHIGINFEVVDIINIAVKKNHQHCGIATLLIKYIINKYKFERMLLEVRSKNNNAIELYKKFNFKVINIRKNYYLDDDALVMEMINK